MYLEFPCAWGYLIGIQANKSYIKAFVHKHKGLCFSGKVIDVSGVYQERFNGLSWFYKNIQSLITSRMVGELLLGIYFQLV